jgi:hypothetical protein
MAQVVISYVHSDYVRAEFMASMLGLQRFGRTSVDAITPVHSGPNIATPRNQIARRFLEESRAPWLWMVDTDMAFSANTLDRLVSAANASDIPILGALCFSQEASGDVYSTMYELVRPTETSSPTLARYRQWPEDTVFPVAATGTGCLLIHRDVLIALDQGGAWPWFKESTLGNQPLGEDLTFCLRAQIEHIPVHVHTGIQVGHMKSVMLGKVA